MARKKKKVELGFIPNEYQKKIFEWVEHGHGNAVIKALAGTGKTSTAIACMKLIPSSQKRIFLAFNKNIADEINKKIGKKCATTVHSLGFSIIKANLGREISVDNYKYISYIKRNLKELSTISGYSKLSKRRKDKYIDNICDLLHFSKCNLCQTAAEIEKLSEKYGIKTLYDESLVVEKCLEWGKKNYNTVDFDDMIWLPNELLLNPCRMQYDWIIFDEGQDASKAAIHIFLKCLKRGGRFISLGDENQQIYMFSGADPDAFKFMCEQPNTMIFDLPITYRCSKEVVKMAQTFTPNIIAKDDAPDGQIIENCKRTVFKDGDMVLCRTNLPLIKLYTELVEKNIQCYINGKDIGVNLIKLIDSTKEEEVNADINKIGVVSKLYMDLFKDAYKLMIKYGIQKDDALLDENIMAFYDSLSIITVLSKDTNSSQELKGRINSIFDNDSKGIMLSTIHKAKGLEADNVYIICRSTMPSKTAKKEWEIKQENNLIYVAITRAKNTLGFVDEKDVKPIGSIQETSAILNELYQTESKIFKLYNKEDEIINDDNNLTLSRYKVKSAKDLTEIVNEKEKNIITLNKDSNKNRKDKYKILNELLNYAK